MDEEITSLANNKQRVFHPIILYHDHHYVENGLRRWGHVRVGEPYYGERIEQRKQEISNMLRHNEQFWASIRKGAHGGINNNNNEKEPSSSSWISISDDNQRRGDYRSCHSVTQHYPSSFINTVTAGSVTVSTASGDNISISSSSSSIPPSPVSPTPPSIIASMHHPHQYTPRHHHEYVRSSSGTIKKQSSSALPTTACSNMTSSINHTKKRRGNLPKPVTAILRDWLAKHKKHPYPTEDEKVALAQQTNLTINQISNWFINARRRILQPMLQKEHEERMMYPTLSMHRDVSHDDDVVDMSSPYDEVGSTQTKKQWQTNMVFRRPSDYEASTSTTTTRTTDITTTARRRSTLRQR
ncbi:hypothetical protein RO3G_07216 [Lichtheimia corymbifera JMRC:FSU:9682]|uniref:Homeobox domain-containing protein n=1 Tax=Lichtheimia corymbifera JMRC:FSU:9682 TaxID=1263082 RepID=A0A068RNT1_9FUNG|nr:hypothetical protein RO3G_07216 [Lichtheimia corymbifera JMRC:FSU:9682]